WLCSCLCFFRISSFSTRRDLPSFPTRRSSDLCIFYASMFTIHELWRRPWVVWCGASLSIFLSCDGTGLRKNIVHILSLVRSLSRSEEHTSELQSREKLVCRLLLEKKK